MFANRCVASCVAISTLIALIVQNKYQKGEGRIVDIQGLLAEVIALSKPYLSAEHTEEFETYMRDSISLDQLHLDEKKRIGYVIELVRVVLLC